MTTTTKATRTISRKEMNEAKNALTSAGWRHSYSVMGDSSTGNEFGCAFVRGNDWFYLNVNTIGEVAARATV